MGYIHCCGALRKTTSYRLVPQEGFVLCELDCLEKCPVCGHKVVQLTRINSKDSISTVRKINQKASAFFNKIKSKILYEEKPQRVPLNGGSFFLNYNEYGVKKRCYSNLSRLKLGLFENKELANNIEKSF